MRQKLLMILVPVLALALMLTPAISSAQLSTRIEPGYTVIYDNAGKCAFAYGTSAPASSVICQAGAIFYRTDLNTWYSMQSGSWSTVPFTLPSPTITSPTITSPTITAPVITGIVTDPTTTAGVGAGTMTGMTITENGSGAVHKTTFTFASASVTMTDAAAAGNQGGQLIYTFPAGYILHLGTTCNLTTLAGAGGIADTAQAVFSVGSVVAAVDNATLTSTEADFIASYAGTLSSGAGIFAKTGTGTFTAFDGHTTAITLYLNAAVPDAGSTTDDTIAYTGTCTTLWANQGDI